MVKDFKPSVSVEEIAAYLDGNLSADETMKMSALISSDSNIREIMSIKENIDGTIESYTPEEISAFQQTIESTSFDLPSLDSLEFDSLLDIVETKQDAILAYGGSEAIGSIAFEDTHNRENFNTLVNSCDDIQSHIENHDIFSNMEINHDDNQYYDDNYVSDDSNYTQEDLNDNINQ